MNQGFGIGISALQANQRALEITGQNIANAQTPGYSRQVADFSNRSPSGANPVGNGVTLGAVRSTRDEVFDAAMYRAKADGAALETAVDLQSRLQTLYAPSGGTTNLLADGVNTFLNQVDRLTADPSSITQRTEVLNAARQLANQFQSIGNGLGELRSGLDSRIEGLVGEANRITEAVARLNSDIQLQTLRGDSTADLVDQRAQLLDKLSGILGFEFSLPDRVQATVVAGNATLVNAGANQSLIATVVDGQVVIRLVGSDQNLPISGGQLGETLAIRNEVATTLTNQLNQLAVTVSSQIDAVFAQGIGLDGPFSQLNGARQVNSISTPLNQGNTSFPLQQGTLTITVTNQPTGQSSVSAININPAAMSMVDVASAIAAIPGLEAFADPQTRNLRIMAEPGYTFSFNGALPTAPISNVSGTTLPQITGTYTGLVNDNYQYTIVGNGTVGVTPGLQVEITNGQGVVLGRHTIGAGYTPGTPLPDQDGVSLTFGSATYTAGTKFDVPVTANADTSGVLVALGLNTVFAGQAASSLVVRPELLRDPRVLGASRSGQANAADLLLKVATLRSSVGQAGGTTASEGLPELAGKPLRDIAQNLASASEEANRAKDRGTQLETQRLALSGVDTNEELLKMVSFQQNYQVASRYLATLRDTFNDLIQVLR